ncbi:hypothetical protein AMATHDRAFT_61329 [Amanita thiersii Skay4041]|uniref:Uncharacterized protein n=1 Tax=Amanita thiersii Skay4041 TaxID=703135 RepID=A0A2A9NJM6_9AGAR|nr:hypothetical protein AMATHDRAFT_61329 [Amanita thiersii Skay4041]
MGTRAAIHNRHPYASGPGYNAPYGAYGSSDPHFDDEAINGAYSSQPQPQASYNPEVYGSYVPYHADPGYQEATREYQAQRAYESPLATTNYVVPDQGPAAPLPLPGETTTSPTPRPAPTTAHSARAEQTKSAAYTEDDVYGGF